MEDEYTIAAIRPAAPRSRSTRPTALGKLNDILKVFSSSDFSVFCDAYFVFIVFSLFSELSGLKLSMFW
jgi:hypothetical protein